MITEEDMRALRVAATMAFALPMVRLRIRNGDRALLDVRQPPFEGQASGACMAPCRFRSAVARAHRLMTEGQRLQFLDVPEGVEPVIEVGLRRCDQLLPGGIYRVTLEERWIYAFATTLDPACCAPLAAQDEPAAAMLGFHWDDATEVTLVHLDTPAAQEASPCVLEDVLHPLLARCATEELMSSLHVDA